MGFRVTIVVVICIRELSTYVIMNLLHLILTNTIVTTYTHVPRDESHTRCAQETAFTPHSNIIVQLWSAFSSKT